MKKGDIVLVSFPFTDLSQTKLRPAVVLFVERKTEDVTLCFISSQALDTVHSGEFVLTPSDPEFSETGLKVASKVRVTRIATLERKLIVRRLGKLGINQMQKLDLALIEAFQLSSNP
jgi:mRNA interferase MazF